MLVGDGLSVYIAVHDAIFRDAASLTSLFKNLLGRGVPMGELLERAESLVPMWDRIGAKVETFRIDYGSYLSDEEEAYFDILARYVNALRKTVAALVARQELAFEGSNGGPKNPMTWAAYKNLDADYETAVEAYSAIGRELSASAPTIFS